MSTQVAEPEVAEPASPPSVYEWQWGWTIAVTMNLPVPLFFGFFAVAKGGIFGMFAGIVAVWLAGCVAVARVPRARRVLVYGGGLFAFSQVFPVAQIAAGAAALDLCASKPGSMSELAALFVTIVTGGQLVFAVLVCGLFVRAVGWLFAGHPQRHPA